MVVTKKWLADQEYQSVVALVPACHFQAIRNHLRNGPAELAEKRAISVDVRKNICSYAPRCRKAGDITEDAETYLVAWCQGQAPCVHPPAKHAVLSYSPTWYTLGGPVQDWVPPSRRRHVDLALEGEALDLSDADSEEDEPLPIKLGE